MGNVVLVDSNYVLKVAMYARENDRKRLDDGRYVGGITGFIDSVVSIVERTAAKSCILVWDCGVSKRRMKRFPKYKSTRWKAREENPDALAFQELFVDQKEVLRDICRSLRLPWVELPGREADDVIIHMVKVLPEDADRIYVASGDKDLLQACRLGAKVYRIHRKDIVTQRTFESKVGISADKYILWRAIVGESGRNDVDGVPNVGEKTATAILTQEGVDSFSAMINYCSRTGASSREKAVVAFFEVICRNIDILDLEREQFTDEESTAMVEAACMRSSRINRKEITQKLIEYDIRTSDFHSYTSLVNQFSFLGPVIRR